MKNETALLYVGLLVICLTAFVGVSSAIQCYQCDSSTLACSENVFLAMGIPKVDDCTCCTKQVSSTGTTRQCQSLLSSINCVNPPSGNYVCATDLCNVANRDGSRIAIATLMTSLMIGALIVRFF